MPTLTTTTTARPRATTIPTTISGGRTPAPIVYPPSAPTNLSGPSSNARVNLTWQPATDDVSGIDHYAIFRAGSKSHWRRIYVSPDTSYTDTTTYAGVDYDYKVRAVDRAHNTGPASTTETVRAAK